MKSKKAIRGIRRNICKHMDWCGIVDCTKCEVELAVEALDKQTPKKPIYSDYGYNGFDEFLPNCARCPSCWREIPYGTWNYEDAHHCECGQAIDWSEEDK